MKKLWLNALTASLILGAVSISAGAQAGDYYRGHDDRHEHREYARDYRHNDWHGYGGYRQVAYREYRPVYYRSAPVYYGPTYYSPVSYYPAPVYGRVGYGGNGVHGSISVGF